MQRDLSSDEEDDRHNLIEQNVRKPPSPPSSASAVFHIEDFSSRMPRLNFKFRKRYSFVILGILIVLLYFTTDAHTLFPTNFPSLKFDPLREQMKESELRALHLLQQQQSELLTIWNHTFQLNSAVNLTNDLNSSSPMQDPNHLRSFSSSALLEDLKSVLFKQISLNKEIQQVLLSPHKTGNLAEPEFGLGNASLGYVSYDRCRTVDQNLSQRRTFEWKPKTDKFLLAICVSGQMSNHLICLEKHMFFAALLNRVLVIPSSNVDYQYDRVLDIVHINKCLGKKVVISFDEFANIKKDHMKIDKFLCYFSLPQPCYLDEDHIKKLKSLGLSMSKPEPVWVEDIKKPKKRTAQDVLSKFTHDDDVMAIGDVFFADVEQEWVTQPGGPLAHKCKTLIEPSRLIMLTAQRFIQTFLGKSFIALHFRRHGFLKFCNVKKPSCFYPIPQAADCILRVVESANAPVIYLSTDAAESETDLLQSLVVLNNKPVPLVKRPARNSAEKWDALLYRHGIEGDSQVEAMLDKTICAMSSVFIGAPGSTFTEDILRLRKDWGSASVCDQYLCQGEEPNIVAENE
ncbi:O-fucosyltransferase 36-like [Prosopis cineraria]|uniref:O-fucosyltransferase 36-like n=1 Tax=Prosopis cineraria TaxID=364024 RepID=UPI00240F03D1|nr:O-fucosyltransferase 36-like [Prosopis cineraria]